jgi:glycosyltransferase involved in cell wall biosynthesis
MRILLAHNSLYYPSYGGGDRSNRLLMQALAARGHEVRVIARVETFGDAAHQRLAAEFGRRGVAFTEDSACLRMRLEGVQVAVVTRDPRLRACFAAEIAAFDPQIILTSTDDPAHLMFETAIRSHARVVYMVRALVALPFGPDAAFPSAAKTDAICQADGLVGVTEQAAEYVRRWAGHSAVHVPISLLDPGDRPPAGRFENRYVTMVNPCAVKGIAILLELARRLPKVEFAAVPTWGTTTEDLAALHALANIAVLPPVDDIHELMVQTKVALVPSLWAEARSRVILEALVRGVPVMASRVGGLSEAMLGVDYLLPVNPVTRYRATVDDLMVPAGEIPPQDAGPWQAGLERLLKDRAHYEELSRRSREAALAYAAKLGVEPFEDYLGHVLKSHRQRRRAAPLHQPKRGLSPEKQSLLASRLRKRSGPRGAAENR